MYTWRRKLATGELTPTIDVFITVYGEPLEIVLATIRAARDMDVPHRTWVLDDGDSDELRDAAAPRRASDYLRRTDARPRQGRQRQRRAAGGPPASSSSSSTPTTCPAPTSCSAALPHMQDPLVAFVQTPQAFPSARGLVAAGAAEAQRIFYELVHAGQEPLQRGVLRRHQRDLPPRRRSSEIGGMYTASNSEDIWTSLELHRRGWRSWFVAETLARGLAPDNLLSYFKQQFRWAYGGFEVLLRGGLFRRKGLTLDQRFQYLLTGDELPAVRRRARLHVPARRCTCCSA